MTYASLSPEERKSSRDFVDAIVDGVKKSMYGLDDVIRLCLISVYSDGHVLLEGNPGLGKTQLVKTLSYVLNLDFGRIQFTPDLMPTDIIGTEMPSGTGEGYVLTFTFQPGPVFRNLLLADEINRATPKTQSALLEAMAERQVTVGGKCYHVPLGELKETKDDKTDEMMPFMVLATQNPIDHEGTYQLPEAQSDRFMFKILMPVPGGDVLDLIMAKDTGVIDPNAAKAKTKESVRAVCEFKVSLQWYQDLREYIRRMEPDPIVREHIKNLFLVTNNRSNESDSLDKKSRETRQELVNMIEYGLGPRAATAMMRGTKAWCLFFETTIWADNIALAKVIIPTLRHRVKLRYDGYEDYRGKYPGMPDARLLDYYLRDLCNACAPVQDGHAREQSKSFKRELDKIVKNIVY